jgi:hypothetical protein
MPETVSPGEVAHTLSHHHGHKTAGEKHAERIEIIEAILLAIVAVATAWSGYQTARWDSDQAHFYGLSNKERAAENRAATRNGQELLFNTSTLGFWLQEKAAGDEKAARLFERRFLPEYRVAFNAWIKTDPLNNPRAPAGPSLMPQYHSATAEEAARHGEWATVYFDKGTEARETGDRYLRNTVLLATVLFLTALAQKFKVLRVRLALLGVAGVLLVVAMYYVVTYPTT